MEETTFTNWINFSEQKPQPDRIVLVYNSNIYIVILFNNYTNPICIILVDGVQYDNEYISYEECINNHNLNLYVYLIQNNKDIYQMKDFNGNDYVNFSKTFMLVKDNDPTVLDCWLTCNEIIKVN